MKRRNITSSVFFFFAGIVISIYAVNYGLGGSRAPGPGFLPFLTGVSLILLSLALLIPSYKDRTAEKRVPFFPEANSSKKVILATSGLLCYGLALEYLGYILTTFLFMIFMLKVLQSQKGLTALLWSFLTAATFYLLFEIVLKSQLPKGILGI